ncbi:MAG: hypothetical protein ACJA08_000481 [Cyclobacteriaceae bacterium]|jgi:hypothetical protein
MKSSKNYLLIILFISCIGFISCSEDEPAPDPVVTLSASSLAFGDVQAGVTATKEFTVTGENITGTVTLSVTGKGFSLSQTVFPIANALNTVTLTFAPSLEATLGAVTGEITVSSGDLTEIIDVTANVTAVPITFLDAGTVIYSSGFEMGKSSTSGDGGHGSELFVEDLESAGTVMEGLTVAYAITHYNDGDDTNTDIGARVQSQRAMCTDTASDGVADADNNDDTDGNCGNAFSVQGPGTSVEIAVSGLEAGQPATVTYWLRLHGSSERGLDASFTGGDTMDNAFTDGTGDSGIYTMYTINGTADIDGNLKFKIEADLPEGTYSRGIAVDEVSIAAR